MKGIIAGTRDGEVLPDVATDTALYTISHFKKRRLQARTLQDAQSK